jgi:hypothetical protein
MLEQAREKFRQESVLCDEHFWPNIGIFLNVNEQNPPRLLQFTHSNQARFSSATRFTSILVIFPSHVLTEIEMLL